MVNIARRAERSNGFDYITGIGCNGVVEDCSARSLFVAVMRKTEVSLTSIGSNALEDG